jgi:hypothetical protein
VELVFPEEQAIRLLRAAEEQDVAAGGVFSAGPGGVQLAGLSRDPARREPGRGRSPLAPRTGRGAGTLASSLSPSGGLLNG